MIFSGNLSIVSRSTFGRGFHSCRALLGRPWKDHHKTIPTVHQSQRGPEDPNIDFNALNLKYPPTKSVDIKIEKYMWSEPPQELPNNLPFIVERTVLGKSLPVYTEWLGSRTKITTIVRRISGDVKVLKEEMEKVCDNKEVIARPGKLVVEGNYHLRLKKWLSGLGF